MNLADAIVIGLGSGLVSTTIAQSPPFERVRAWIADQWEPLGKLVSCPYCLGHWVAIAFCLVQGEYHPITWAAVAGVSTLTSGALDRLF